MFLRYKTSNFVVSDRFLDVTFKHSSIGLSKSLCLKRIEVLYKKIAHEHCLGIFISFGRAYFFHNCPQHFYF
jgi:hypothetical protein